MKRGNIVIYNDSRAHTSVSCLPEALGESFPDKKNFTADNNNFLQALDENRADIAVIPGIWTENSKYYDMMGGDSGQKKLQDFVSNGGILMTICAGSYLVSQKTEYIPPWGDKRERTNNTALFNALARGPLQGMGMEPDGPEWYDGVHAVPVKFKAADGAWKETQIAYGNGPALFPHNENHNYEVLARYSSLPDAPIAAAWQNVGKGAALWLGVLPHIGWQKVDNNPSIKKIWKLMNELQPHEPARKELWDGMMGKIANHLTP